MIWELTKAFMIIVHRLLKNVMCLQDISLFTFSDFPLKHQWMFYYWLILHYFYVLKLS